jgi:hypothetical protein
MNERKVAGSKKTTETRVRISDLSGASTPEYDTEVPTLPHYVQRNHFRSTKCRVCNIKCGYISLNQFQRASYVTGMHNRSELFSFVRNCLLSCYSSTPYFVFLPFVFLPFDLTFPYLICMEVHAMIKKLWTHKRERIVCIKLVTI